ncbi:prepilin-type N-terminal cleavage/methylation domain-containing protein [Candidatus Cyanaurora vandensis]|uniref:type IV pilus modification PilV family protein n=1 Tax=Candidatus Cyanaurora vandensis TaxID=2714958 RepID=UPI00257B69CF|nr:type II secretion system protein [Candidatus Cyanaurora vandensis]
MKTRQRQGAALIEVLVALVILTILLVALLPGLTGSAVLLQQNSQVNLAAQVAKEQLEKIRALYIPVDGLRSPRSNVLGTGTFYCTLGEQFEDALNLCPTTLTGAETLFGANATVYRVRSVVTDGPVGCWFQEASVSDTAKDNLGTPLVCYETPAAAATAGVFPSYRSSKQVTVWVYMEDTPTANDNNPQVSSVQASSGQAGAETLRSGPLVILSTTF